jgi:enoyl-CoA hydratase/carnithine racemase
LSDASAILVRLQGDVGPFLHRPERRNAIDRAMVDALRGALDGGHRVSGRRPQ